MKRFNTTGLCNPKKHYMVNISEKLEKIKALIENEEYFVINRPRQYGKTTTLTALENSLKEKYLVISISFEGIGDIAFSNEEKFVIEFINLIEDILNCIDENLSETFKKLSLGVCTLSNLSRLISKFIKKLDKEVILIIDEVDKSSNNQIFLNFLAMLRNKYLDREKGKAITFKSVILAGVYDIKNLKLKLRPEEERKYNFSWNIVASFKVDMSLHKDGIKNMLDEYKKDKNLTFDTLKSSEFIYFYTNGYPFLVSRLCQIIDEDLDSSWNEENMLKAVKLLLSEKNTLFDDVIKNVSNNKDLYEYIFDIVFNGEEKDFNIDNNIVDLGVTFGYFKEEDGKVKISNRLLEQRLYNYFVTNLKLRNVAGYK